MKNKMLAAFRSSVPAGAARRVPRDHGDGREQDAGRHRGGTVAAPEIPGRACEPLDAGGSHQAFMPCL